MLLLTLILSSAYADTTFQVGDCIHESGYDAWQRGYYLITKVGKFSYKTRDYSVEGFYTNDGFVSFDRIKAAGGYDKFECPGVAK